MSHLIYEDGEGEVEQRRKHNANFTAHSAALAALGARVDEAVGTSETIALSASESAAAASRAETARDAAFVNADVYADVTAGIAGVADGEQFQVTDEVSIQRYKKAGSVAELVASYPAASHIAYKLPRGPLGIRHCVIVGNDVVQYVDDQGIFHANTLADASADQGQDGAATPSIVLEKSQTYLTNRLIHKLVVGQSNALATGAFVPDVGGAYDIGGTTALPIKGDVISTTDSAYTGYALDLFSYSAGFFPLKEYVTTNTDGSGNITGAGETIRSGWSNAFQKWLRDGNWIYPRALATVHAVGATAYAGLKKGTSIYTSSIARVQKAYDLSVAASRTHEVQSISIIHGESQTSTSADVYAGYLNEWRSDYTADVKAINSQQHEIVAFVAGLSTFEATTYQIPLGQLLAHERYPYIVYTTPTYHLPYWDQYHRLAISNYKIGEYEARAERFWMAGKKWHPLRPISVTRSGLTVTVETNADVYGGESSAGPVGALVIDTSTLTDPGDYGFRVSDPLVSITAVAVSGSSVILTLDAVPAPGSEVSYAMQYDLRNTGSPSDDYIRFAFAGARGNIRDSDQRDTSIYDDSYLYNWLVPFAKTIY